MKFSFPYSKRFQHLYPYVWSPDDLKFITRGARVPVQASQELPGNAERSQIQTGLDVYINANVSIHI